MDTFEKRFRLLRGSMTQPEFADKVGITKQKVSNYEKGLVRPTYEVFCSLIIRLRVNINWLITGDGPIYIEDVSKNSKKKTKQNG